MPMLVKWTKWSGVIALLSMLVISGLVLSQPSLTGEWGKRVMQPLFPADSRDPWEDEPSRLLVVNISFRLAPSSTLQFPDDVFVRVPETAYDSEESNRSILVDRGVAKDATLAIFLTDHESAFQSSPPLLLSSRVRSPGALAVTSGEGTAIDHPFNLLAFPWGMKLDWELAPECGVEVDGVGVKRGSVSDSLEHDEARTYRFLREADAPAAACPEGELRVTVLGLWERRLDAP